MVNTPTKKTSSKQTSTNTTAKLSKLTANSHIFTKFVGSLEIKPKQQSRMSLGMFNPKNPAKGFSVNLDLDPESSDNVTTEITTLGNSARYELILQVANFGDHKLQAEIWQI